MQDASETPAAQGGDAVVGRPVTPAQTTETTATPQGEAKGGLPQFQFEHWAGQILWLLILFGALYLLLARVFTPKLRQVRDEREAAIGGAIEDARRVRAEADAQAAAAKAEMAEARAKAQAAAADAKARANAEAANRSAAQEADLAQKLSAAEDRIRASRDAAMAKVAGIASETAGAIVEKLTGQGASPDELDAALASAKA